jgi:hypothetical protein
MEWSKSSDTNILFSLHLHDRQLYDLLTERLHREKRGGSAESARSHMLLHREPKRAAQVPARVTGVTLLTHRP